MDTPSDLRSPYQPPSADLADSSPGLPPLEPHVRSGAPKVFGVLSIIFASLVLLSSSLGMLMMLATSAFSDLGNLVPEAEKTQDVAAMMEPMVRIYRGIGLQSAILFVMSALLLAIGIGQLRYRVWAQRWSVYWGAAGLVCVAAMVAISLLIISPAYAQFFQGLSQLKPQGDGQPQMPSMGPLAGIFGGTFAVVCVLFYGPYPALMLMFFTRDRVRASMTSSPL